MSEQKLTLASGAEITVRSMRIAEVNRWAGRMGEGDKSEPTIGSNKVFADILKNCTTSIVSPGPCYDEFSWETALIADRFQALCQIRHLSYPDIPYSFSVQCENCDKKFVTNINVGRGGDITYRDVPESARLTYRNGNRFEATVGTRKVVFKLANGKDEAVARRLVQENRDKAISAGLSARIIELDGVTERNELMKLLEDMDLQDFTELKTLMEDVDGGVETEIDARCPHCEHVNFEVSLPFGRSFILPTSFRRSR